MNLPKKCLVDTNVPKTANLATQPDPNSDVSDACVLACIEAIEHVINKRGLIIDAGDEIFDEYRQQLSMKGQPGVGDRFMKWVHDNRWSLHDSQRVTITRNGDSYDEFPTHDGSERFRQIRPEVCRRGQFTRTSRRYCRPPTASGGDGRMP